MSYVLSRNEKYKYKPQREDIVSEIEKDLGLDYINLLDMDRKKR